MNSQKYNIFVLSNGLKCVHSQDTGNVSYCGVIVNAGSRDESEDREGLAHFVEHTIFKGTRHRNKWHISNRMERVGGELNAFTTKEETAIYTVFPKGNLQRAVELLSDLIGYSSFPQQELELEKEVVIDEINSYLDSPSESVFDEFEDLIYKGSRMGHNILGSPESVRNLNSIDCKEFIDRFYTPGNMAVYVVDSAPFSTVEKLITKHFDKFNHPEVKETRIVPTATQAFDITKNQSGHQAHTIVGSRVFGRNDKRRHALFLLNNYLGGPCMNSRLNQELRERRGYVYTVDSSVGLMSDCGLLQIYFGCDKRHINQCKKIIRRELDNLAEKTISPRLFEQIRNQYIGQLQVSAENRESCAISLGKSLLYYNTIYDIAWSAERLREVTAEDVRQVAELLSAENCASLTLV